MNVEEFRYYELSDDDVEQAIKAFLRKRGVSDLKDWDFRNSDSICWNFEFMKSESD